MKKLFAATAVAAATLLTGCATSVPVGVFYTDVTLPAEATSNSAAGKVGKATCQSILSLVATGDCSIEAAKKNAGITEVTHVDCKANNILGIIGTYTVTVHGR